MFLAWNSKGEKTQSVAIKSPPLILVTYHGNYGLINQNNFTVLDLQAKWGFFDLAIFLIYQTGMFMLAYKGEHT